MKEQEFMEKSKQELEKQRQTFGDIASNSQTEVKEWKQRIEVLSNNFEQERLDFKKKILQLEEQIQLKSSEIDKERSTWKEQLLRTSEMMKLAETELQAKTELNEHLSVQLHEINDQILSGKISIEEETRKYTQESSQLKEKLQQEELYRKQLEEGLRDLKRHLHKEESRLEEETQRLNDQLREESKRRLDYQQERRKLEDQLHEYKAKLSAIDRSNDIRNIVADVDKDLNDLRSQLYEERELRMWKEDVISKLEDEKNLLSNLLEDEEKV